ncbi:MAG: hypothetical protein Kow00107_05030 [Planctomycetota bacterium]
MTDSPSPFCLSSSVRDLTGVLSVMSEDLAPSCSHRIPRLLSKEPASFSGRRIWCVCPGEPVPRIREYKMLGRAFLSSVRPS